MGSTLKKKALKHLATPQPEPARVLLLRTCDADGRSYGGFKWPLTVGAKVVAPDWDARQQCGNGLHGLLWGEGDGGLLSWASDAAWLVVSADASDVVNLSGNVKVPAARVEHVGDRASAPAYLAAHGAVGRAIVGGTATAGDMGTATAGDMGTATAGYMGTATAGYMGVIVLRWYHNGCYRAVVGVVGENGITANVAYRLDAAGKFVEAPTQGGL